MWIIETYRETGEFHELSSGERWPKNEALEEPVGDRLEDALATFVERYPFEQYMTLVVWHNGERRFHAEKHDCPYRNTEACLVYKAG